MASPAEGNSTVDRLKGKAKSLAGAVLGNEDLEREGHLHEERADALDDAQRLDAEAAEQEHEARLAEREQEITEERALLDLEEAEDKAQARIAADKASEEARISREAADRKQAATAQAGAQKAAATRSETAAVGDHGSEVRDAASLAAAADQAREEAERLDAQAQQTDNK
ncbi:MAG: hypothetical protein ACR2MB_17785 [Acidimicrobiales bacterium]